MYQETVEKARTDNLRMVGEAKAGIVGCEKALCRLTAMERDINAKRDLVARSVAQVRRGYQRQEYLVAQVRYAPGISTSRGTWWRAVRHMYGMHQRQEGPY